MLSAQTAPQSIPSNIDRERLTRLAEIGDIDAQSLLIRLDIRAGLVSTVSDNYEEYPVGQCVRCGLDLTDPVSRQHRIGPICRKLNNSVLASAMPADKTKARAAFQAAVDSYSATPRHPMVGRYFDEIAIELWSSRRQDYRQTVLNIERSLGYGLQGPIVQALYEVVDALGYGLLVSVWRGDAVKGAAAVVFRASYNGLPGRVVILAPKMPRDLRIRLQEAIPGAIKSEASNAWTFPATYAEAVVAIARTAFCDIMSSDLRTIRQAREWAEANPEEAAAATRRYHVRTFANGIVQVQFEYHRDIVQDVIGAIPEGHKRWSRKNSNWEFTAEYAPRVIEALEDCFP